MTSLVIEAHRKRFTPQATPMASLDSLVQQVLDKLGLADVAPTDCKLFLDKKEITDRDTPIRLLGLPRGAKLDLFTGREPTLGVQDNTTKAAAPNQQQQSKQPSTINPPPPSSSTQQQPGGPSSASVHQPPKPVEEIIHPVFGKYGHSIRIFTRQAELDLEASLASTGTGGEEEGVEDEDSYFEFTEADFKKIQASAASRRAKEASSTLMTKAMREGQERRNAQLVGDVIIRAELNTTGTATDHVVVQVTIPATESLGELKRLIFSVLDLKLTTDSSDGGAKKKKVGASSSSSSLPYLYTTPPKTVLKDDDKMIYSLGLYPAARVHIGLGGSGPSPLLLRSEAQTLVGPPPSKADAMHRHRLGEKKEGTSGDRKGKEAANNNNNNNNNNSRPTQAGGKPVPKWLKLGK